MSAAPPRILLVSNGFGEMAILQSIARAIAGRAPEAVLRHLPLVGSPRADAWPPLVGPRRDMPSGGLVTYWNMRNIARDVSAGLIGLTIAQFRFLAAQRHAFDAVVAVGDVYCAATCMWFARLPTVFVATAKSEYVAGHSALELAIARRARLTFARDAATAQALASRGVPARYVGNVMMDGVAATETVLPIDAQALHVAVLPGSRRDAPANAGAAARRLRRIAQLGGRRVQAFVAVAPTVAAQDLAAALRSQGFRDGAGGEGGAIAARLTDGDVEIVLVEQALGATLRAADVVLGQAGTGNEQAAGLGKPVIAAAAQGESPQDVGWYRMRQRKLLGEALVVAPADDDAFAQTVLDLIADPARMTMMAKAGRERMGEPGASAAIAHAALAVAAGASP